MAVSESAALPNSNGKSQSMTGALGVEWISTCDDRSCRADVSTLALPCPPRQGVDLSPRIDPAALTVPQGLSGQPQMCCPPCSNDMQSSSSLCSHSLADESFLMVQSEVNSGPYSLGFDCLRKQLPLVSRHGASVLVHCPRQHKLHQRRSGQAGMSSRGTADMLGRRSPIQLSDRPQLLVSSNPTPITIRSVQASVLSRESAGTLGHLPDCSHRLGTPGPASVECRPNFPNGLNPLDGNDIENDAVLSDNPHPIHTPTLNLPTTTQDAHMRLAFELFGPSALLPPLHRQTHEPVNLKKDRWKIFCQELIKLVYGDWVFQSLSE